MNLFKMYKHENITKVSSGFCQAAQNPIWTIDTIIVDLGQNRVQQNALKLALCRL